MCLQIGRGDECACVFRGRAVTDIVTLVVTKESGVRSESAIPHRYVHPVSRIPLIHENFLVLDHLFRNGTPLIHNKRVSPSQQQPQRCEMQECLVGRRDGRMCS